MKKNFKKLLVLPLTLLLASCDLAGTSSNKSVEEPSSSVVSVESQATSENTPSATTSDVVTSSEDEGRTYNTNDKKIFIEELEVGDIAEDVTNDIFTFVKKNDETDPAKPKKNMAVAECDVTFNEEKYTKYLKTQSASVTSEGKVSRVISFEATGKGTVKILAKSPNESERSVCVFNKEKGVQHSSAKVTSELSMVELEFHYAGTYFITAPENISIYYIEASWEDGVNDEWEPAIELTNENTLLVSELPSKDYKEKTTVGSFTLNPGATTKDGEEVKGKITVEGNTKKYDGVSYTSRLKLNAIGTRDYSSIIIHTTGQCIVHVIASSSSDGTPSKVNLVKLGATAAEDEVIGDGTIDNTVTVTTPNSDKKMYELVFPVSSEGDYAFFAYASKACNIYCIEIEY